MRHSGYLLARNYYFSNPLDSADKTAKSDKDRDRRFSIETSALTEPILSDTAELHCQLADDQSVQIVFPALASVYMSPP